MSFTFEKLSIPGPLLIKPYILSDQRGTFMEIYRYSEFTNAGITMPFIQDNISKSKKNTLRGLHYQKNPKAQGKLVSCLKGKIFDIAVDVRMGSPTYAQWISVELSEENNFMLYVPATFAHGFLALSDTAEVIYKCTEEYSPKDEAGIIWNDPDINIKWPVANPTLSEKDKKLPALSAADNNFRY